MATDEMTRGIARANQRLLASLMHHLVDADIVPRDWVMHLLHDAEVHFLTEAAKVNGSMVEAVSGQSVIETQKIFEGMNPYLGR